MNWFSKIHELAGQEYERYLPTAFDSSLTLLEKVNKVIETLNQIVAGVNTVADYVDENVDTQNEKIIQLRDDFEILKDWLENEGLEERTTQVLNEWFDNGRLAQIINNDVFNMKVDKTVFEQFVVSTNQQLQQTEQDLTTQLQQTEQDLTTQLQQTEQDLTTQLQQTEQGLTTHLQQTVGNSQYFWTPPTQPHRDTVIPNYNYSTQLALWDDFISTDPNYTVTKTNVGTDSSGIHNLYKYVFTPKNYDKTVIINAGIHGNERMGVALLYRFFYHLVNDSDKYQQLANARNNIRFVVIPILNPYGYENSTRENFYNIDINRNFNYNFSKGGEGTAPLSEKETKIMDNVLKDYPNAVGYIDIHNTGTHPDMHYYCTVPQVGYNHTEKVKEIMEFCSNGRTHNTRFQFENAPVSCAHGEFVRGIPSIIAEAIPGIFGNDPQAEDDMTEGLKFIANIILYMTSLNSLKTIHLVEPSALTFRHSAASFQTDSTDFQTVDDIVITLTPEISGLLVISGVVNVLAIDSTKNVYGVCSVTQDSNPAIAQSTESSLNTHFSSYGRGERIGLPLNRTVQVLPKTDLFGDVEIRIKLRVDSGNTVQHLRSSLNITFIPTSKWGVVDKRVDGSGNIVNAFPVI